MDQDPANSQCIGHRAGVLAARAAKAREGVAGDVMASLDRDLADRVRHVVDRYPQKTARNGVGFDAALIGHIFQARACRPGIERGIAPQAEYLREVLGSIRPSTRLQSVTVSGPSRP